MVIVVARLAGALFERLRQPAVIGEVIAGIALGPSVLGGWSDGLFPDSGRPLLRILAGGGILLGLAGVTLFVLSRRARRRTPPAPLDDVATERSEAPTGPASPLKGPLGPADPLKGPLGPGGADR